MLKSEERAARWASGPSDLHLTSPPIESPTSVESQRAADEEHVASGVCDVTPQREKHISAFTSSQIRSGRFNLRPSEAKHKVPPPE